MFVFAFTLRRQYAFVDLFISLLLLIFFLSRTKPMHLCDAKWKIVTRICKKGK